MTAGALKEMRSSKIQEPKPKVSGSVARTPLKAEETGTVITVTGMNNL